MPLPVALRKESVDRNAHAVNLTGKMSWSLSARRAWIEIGRTSTTAKRFPQSLSARRAWIEILLVLVFGMPTSVALRKESVDRNTGP